MHIKNTCIKYVPKTYSTQLTVGLEVPGRKKRTKKREQNEKVPICIGFVTIFCRVSKTTIRAAALNIKKVLSQQ